jgi:hypothetical protein
MRWIVAAGRNLGRDAVWMKMMEAVNLRQQFPDLVIGFDLVDEEDRFYTLLHYLDLFMKMDSYTKSNNMSGKSVDASDLDESNFLINSISSFILLFPCWGDLLE